MQDREEPNSLTRRIEPRPAPHLHHLSWGCLTVLDLPLYEDYLTIPVSPYRGDCMFVSVTSLNEQRPPCCQGERQLSQ